jgi:hypothetical protein
MCGVKGEEEGGGRDEMRDLSTCIGSTAMGSGRSTCIVSVAPTACPLDPTVVELFTARLLPR